MPIVQGIKRRIYSWLINQIDNLDVIRDLLKDSICKGALTVNTVSMVEAALDINLQSAKSIMIPRSQITFLNANDSLENVLKIVIDTGHSRFPVLDKDNDILGIFHSKDLLPYVANAQDEFVIVDHVRKVYFVPDIKSLGSLIYEMRAQHTHMVLVVDEFTNIVGLVTLEMILEQIVGDIEDEYDFVENHDILEVEPNVYRVKGECHIRKINQVLQYDLRDSDVDTIGGLIIRRLGKIPKLGAHVLIDGLNVEIISADSRRIKVVNVKR